MDFFPRTLPDADLTALSGSLPLDAIAHEPTPSVQDSIASLMSMADSMEALLPRSPPRHTLPAPKPPRACLSSVTSDPRLTKLPIELPASLLRDVTDASRALPLAPPPPPPPPPPPLHAARLDRFDRPDRLDRFAFLGENTSPCSVREFPPAARVQKPRKTPRKPKTYSKPVASRFCHICSRMPRRGQGSATCRRMREGFCRKIVCEQCLREQGWDYDHIARHPDAWLCPHCADACPPRSQCHIYNRINARRKRAPQKQPASVAAALASSDLLLGPYAHLFNGGQAPSAQILQPPPNFRLNLPPQYSQQ